MGSASSTILNPVITSRALKKPMRLCVYLPPYYSQFKMRYPVVYLLHPWGCDERYYVDHLKLHQVADHLINTGTIPPFIAAMPQGDKSFFVNAADPFGDYSAVVKSDPEFFQGALEGFGRYGDYIADDLIPSVEETYRTRTDRAGRVIAGISMGGAGAAALAFSDPALFGAVGVHSPALYDDERLGPPWIFGLGDEEAFARRDPIHLAGQLSPEAGLHIYLDCGADDEMADLTARLHRALADRRITHTYASRPGGHMFDYWQAHLAEYLGFYAGGW